MHWNWINARKRQPDDIECKMVGCNDTIRAYTLFVCVRRLPPRNYHNYNDFRQYCRLRGAKFFPWNEHQSHINWICKNCCAHSFSFAPCTMSTLALITDIVAAMHRIRWPINEETFGQVAAIIMPLQLHGKKSKRHTVLCALEPIMVL